MNILFVYSIDNAWATKAAIGWGNIQFGISYISSVLKANNHHTQLIVLGSNNRRKTNVQQLRLVIEEFNPGLICFTAVFSQYSFIKEMAKSVKEQWPAKFLLIGGVHASLNSDEVIDGPFNALCIGEGEYPTLKLCTQLDAGNSPHKIANLWIKSQNGKIEKNEPREFIQDIDVLPLPDRKMWETWIKKEQIDAELSILLGRGCPFDCTYCCNHSLRKIASGKYVRMRSPENIIREITLLHNTYPYKKIYFEVESIVLDKGWIFDLCSQLEVFNSKISRAISYGCNFRISPQSLDEKIFMALKKANFYKINIGLESGNERIRKDVLKRNYSNDDFINVVSMARKYGLKVFIFNMIGLPTESFDDHIETVLLNRQCQPDGHYTGIFYPYPGTELYELCAKNGLINDNLAKTHERRRAIIESPGFSKKQIEYAYHWFAYRIYKTKYKSFLGILRYFIADKIKSNILMSYCFDKIVKLPGSKKLWSLWINRRGHEE